jgi:dihydrofolate reductase
MESEMISIIVAMDKNRLIGRNNRIPWQIHEDLTYFRKTTMGHVVVMGRKTHESLGKPLDGRTNVVLTRQADYRCKECTILHSVQEVLDLFPDQEVFVIGGTEIFKEFLPYAKRLYLTKIDKTYEGDAWFPEFDEQEWILDSYDNHTTNDRSHTNFAFLIYRRRT